MPTIKRLVIQLHRLEKTVDHHTSRVLITPYHGHALSYQTPAGAVVAYQLSREALLTHDHRLIPAAVKELNEAGYTLEKRYDEKRKLVAAAVATRVGLICFYQRSVDDPHGFIYTPYQKTNWLLRLWRRFTA